LQLGSEIAELDRYIAQNTEGFRKILKKYKKHTKRSVIWFKARESDSYLHKAVNVVHELVVKLSRTREAIAGIGVVSGESTWEPPASFERTTTKYWVKPGDITALKVEVLKHVPILEINSSEEVEVEFFKQGLSQTHNYISSV
jgi:SPX domain protein involved in polyphosphate accumulation